MPPTPPIEALIFDMDGVVIDSEPLHERSALVVFKRYGLDIPESLFKQFKGKTAIAAFKHIADTYLGDQSQAETLLREKQEAYFHLMDELELVDGFFTFLENARPRFKIALTTSAVRANQRLAFEKFNLEGYFDVVITADDITQSKPHPEPYAITVRHLGAPPQSCLVVEDAVAGIQSARAAGCFTTGITTTFNAPDLLQAGAHLVFDTYPVLANHLALSYT